MDGITKEKMKPYSEFCHAMRVRESSDKYDCVNSLGFLGAYQFGMARLCDLGLTERINPASSSMANSAFRWKKPHTAVDFLNSAVLQDATFLSHVLNLKRRLDSRLGGVIKVVKVADQLGTLSGAVACAHLLGIGGVSTLLVRGIDQADAYGTLASEYYLKFSGYELP